MAPTIKELEIRITELGGDPTADGDRRPKKELEVELEQERLARQAAESGTYPPETFCSPFERWFETPPALKEAESANEGHLEAIDKLEQTLFELQGEIGGGRHIPPGVRVLSLRENPASQWEDLSKRAMDRLKDENEALLKRLKQLEDGGVRVAGGPDEDLIPRESFEVVTREKEELQEALKQKEKRLIRLKQVRRPMNLLNHRVLTL